jgi:hypothetical protein
MATDLEQLQVTLSAKADQFKQEMQSAVREFEKDANQIEQRNQQLTASMERSMSQSATSVRFLSGAFKGLFSVYAVQQFISAVKDANTAVAQLGESARRLEISPDKFQALNYAGKTLGGLSQDQVSSGAMSLQQKANTEVREGEGKLTNLLQANNMKLTDRQGKVKDINSLLEMAASLIMNARSEADKIHIAELFGLTKEWVGALEKGPAAFKNAQAAAKTTGAIIDAELVKKAEEFDRFWNDSWSKFAQNAKSAAVTAGGWIRGILAQSGLTGDVGALRETIQQLEETRKNVGADDIGTRGTIDRALLTARKNLAEIEGQAEAASRKVLAQRLTDDAARLPGAPSGPRYDPKGPFGALRPIDARDPDSPTKVPKEGKEASAKRDELERAEKALTKQTIALDAQAEALKKTGEEAAFLEAQTKLLETAQEAGIKVTAEKRLTIDRLSDAYAKATTHLKAMRLETDLAFERSQIGRDADEQAIASRTRGLPEADAKRLGDTMRENQRLLEGKEMAGSFVKGLISDLENGVKAGRALENQLKRIADKLADKAIDSLISGLFGVIPKGLVSFGVPAQAGGGWAGQGPLVNVPASAFIGARQFAAGGGIPAILHAGEIVLNQAQQKNVAQGLGPSKAVTITHAPTINGTGLSAEQVFSVVQRSQKEFARQIGPIFNDWQMRHG